jgi:hypothetical protein
LSLGGELFRSANLEGLHALPGTARAAAGKPKVVNAWDLSVTQLTANADVLIAADRSSVCWKPIGKISNEMNLA